MTDGSSRCVEANVQDREILARKFELQSFYYVHFRTKIPGKGMSPYPLS